MLEFLFALAALGVVTRALLARSYSGSTRVRAWTRAAQAAGLTDLREDISFWSTGRVTGRSGDVPVSFEVYNRGEFESGTRITFRTGCGITLRREGIGTAFVKAIGPREVEIGDDVFDRVVLVHGHPEVARAVLDTETRGVFQALLEGWVPLAGGSLAEASEVTVCDGVLQVDLREGARGPDARLPAIVSALVDTARRLEVARLQDLPRRIAANTATENEWRVRLANIALLAEGHPRHPATREALERACADESQDVQLRAALALGGEKGHATLLEIASREWADDSCAARAIATLGRRLPLDRAKAILSNAIRKPLVETARACLDVLGCIGGEGVVDTLARVLAGERGELGVAAARALGACGAPAAEGSLVEALHHESPEVRAAAAKALGKAGSVVAVLPLKEAAERDSDLRRTARQAIAEIQSRLSGASPGQLSLAHDDAGRLSLADEDPRGQVSLANDVDGHHGGKPS